MQEIQHSYAEDGVIRQLRERLIGEESSELDELFAKKREEALADMDAIFTQITETRRIGRNDPCPCNSGAKFKKCCGVNFRSDDDRLSNSGESQCSSASADCSE